MSLCLIVWQTYVRIHCGAKYTGESGMERMRETERKTEQRGWKKRDWNILCVKIELENEGHRHPPLQHLLLSSRLSFFGFHLYRCCLFKMKLTD